MMKAKQKKNKKKDIINWQPVVSVDKSNQDGAYFWVPPHDVTKRISSPAPFPSIKFTRVNFYT